MIEISASDGQDYGINKIILDLQYKVEVFL